MISHDRCRKEYLSHSHLSTGIPRSIMDKASEINRLSEDQETIR